MSVTTTPTAPPAGFDEPGRPRETGPDGTEDIKPLPVWFFGFEAVFASAFDLAKAYPQSLWVLGALAAVNIALTLTVLRTRVRLARRLWRGKGTRKIAIGLVVLRVGSHFALTAAGADITTTAGHLEFAAVMGVVTVTLLWFTQRTALRALSGRSEAPLSIG